MPYSKHQGSYYSYHRPFQNPFFNYILYPFWGHQGYPTGPGPYPSQQFPGQSGPYPGPTSPYPGQGMGGSANQPPMMPPPPFMPEKPQMQTKAIDPGAIRGCLYRYTYIWTENDSFWFYPTYIGRNSISGYRWSRNRWVYFGIDLYNIQSFQCYS